MGDYLTKGTTYVDGGTINAANLNAHVDDSVLKSTAISARTSKVELALTDELLINDSGTLKKTTGQGVYDALIEPGSVIQSTYGMYTANANLTAVIPFDDTIPQVTEGTEIISLSFTPRFSNSKMVLRLSGTASVSAGYGVLTAIFRDTVTDAIAASWSGVSGPDLSVVVNIIAIDLPATASTITYTVRAGLTTAGILRFNGSTSARYFGGTSVATLEVQEIKVL